jgi:hypothetical protein
VNITWASLLTLAEVYQRTGRVEEAKPHQVADIAAEELGAKV